VAVKTRAPAMLAALALSLAGWTVAVGPSPLPAAEPGAPGVAAAVHSPRRRRAVALKPVAAADHRP
jgi:hypothetical protein